MGKGEELDKENYNFKIKTPSRYRTVNGISVELQRLLS